MVPETFFFMKWLVERRDSKILGHSTFKIPFTSCCQVKQKLEEKKSSIDEDEQEEPSLWI